MALKNAIAELDSTGAAYDLATDCHLSRDKEGRLVLTMEYYGREASAIFEDLVRAMPGVRGAELEAGIRAKMREALAVPERRRESKR